MDFQQRLGDMGQKLEASEVAETTTQGWGCILMKTCVHEVSFFHESDLP